MIDPATNVVRSLKNTAAPGPTEAMAEKNWLSAAPIIGRDWPSWVRNGPAAVISSWKPGRAASTSPARPVASAWIAPESASPWNIAETWGPIRFTRPSSIPSAATSGPSIG